MAGGEKEMLLASVYLPYKKSEPPTKKLRLAVVYTREHNLGFVIYAKPINTTCFGETIT